MTHNRLEILVVDDHLVVREGLKRILQDCDDCVVTAEAGNVADALAWLRRRSFDLVLLDISLPERTGLDLLKDDQEGPAQASRADSERVSGGSLRRAGVQGRRRRLSQQGERLGIADRRDPQGSLGRQVSVAGARGAHRAGDWNARRPPFARGALGSRVRDSRSSSREARASRHIGEQLHISPKTVTTYRARILEKTGLASNAELTRYMLENNLLD